MQDKISIDVTQWPPRENKAAECGWLGYSTSFDTSALLQYCTVTMRITSIVHASCCCCVLSVITQYMYAVVSWPNTLYNGKMEIGNLPSTPQSNTSDCGVFAAAYATELAAPGNTSDLYET